MRVNDLGQRRNQNNRYKIAIDLDHNLIIVIPIRKDYES